MVFMVFLNKIFLHSPDIFFDLPIIELHLLSGLKLTKLGSPFVGNPSVIKYIFVGLKFEASLSPE